MLQLLGGFWGPMERRRRGGLRREVEVTSLMLRLTARTIHMLSTCSAAESHPNLGMVNLMCQLVGPPCQDISFKIIVNVLGARILYIRQIH